MKHTGRKTIRTIWIVAVLTFGKSFFIPLAVGSFFGLILSYCIDSIEKKWVKNIRAKIFVMVWFILTLLLLVYGLFSLFWYTQNNRESIRKILVSSWETILQFLSTKTPLTDQNITKLWEDLTSSLAINSAEQWIGDTFVAITNFILVLVYTVLIPIYKKKIILWLDILTHNKWAQAYKDIQYTVTKYTQGLFLLMIIVAILYLIWLTIFNVPYAPLIAICSALMTLVPTVWTMVWGVGAIVSASLLTWSITVAVSMTLWYIGIQFFEEYLILPYVVGRKVSLNVFAAILAIVVWWLLWWVAGIFLAMPIVGIIQKFLENAGHPLSKVIK